ncbi:hypothetical protein [Halomicronema sp. CCY15110]|uniref:hypothetical protein n=1 Tax=Halomicronema sp. CCY15110 TaxID=2767773 RepID=UPI00194E7DDC|nr:hypothetical protein [Halomicronema sp. CCY15110]
MLFDRIIEDSLGYIRRKLWSETDHDQGAKNQFQSTKSIPGEFGIIHLLEGRDTPRAIRTWMLSPKRQKMNSAHMVATSTPMDLHIYTDFLGPLPKNTTPSAMDERKLQESQRQRGLSVATHRLQLLKSSHFLNKDGFYTSEVLHWQDVDCYPPNGSNLPPKAADKIAMRFTDAVAFKCLKLPQPMKLPVEEWTQIINETLAEVKAKLVAKSV